MSDTAAPEALLQEMGDFATPGRRRGAARALARRLGGTDLLLFGMDPELAVPLPAPGLPQVLRDAVAWQTFLALCVREGSATARLTSPDGSLVDVAGCALPDGTAAVLLDSSDPAALCNLLLPVLPLLGALFHAERRISTDQVKLDAAANAKDRAQILAHALDEMRQRLRTALDEAHAARTEARARADQAEALAAELEAQAEELQQQAIELETLNEELSEQTAEAMSAREEADRANHAKSNFLASMSHELRTPINAVIGYAQLLSMGISGAVSEEQRSQLQRIEQSSAHLLSLVNDVLDLAKVEAGEMTVERQRENAKPVVLESLALIEGHALAKGVTLVNECSQPDLTYFGDRDRVRQVLVNLLSNAVKFTEQGGRVTVEARVRDRPESGAHLSGEGPWLTIAVEDTGIGMAEEELPRVFQPFVQVDDGYTRRRGGTGLGLTISRQLARLMGGDLTLRSQTGVGSRFTLWLPVAGHASGELDPAIRVRARGAAG